MFSVQARVYIQVQANYPSSHLRAMTLSQKMQFYWPSQRRSGRVDLEALAVVNAGSHALMARFQA